MRNRPISSDIPVQVLSPSGKVSVLQRFTSQNDPRHSYNSEDQQGRTSIGITHPRVSWSFAQGPYGRELIVPIGSALPASLVDDDENANEAQIEAMDGIASDFIEALAAVADAPESSTSSGRKAKPVDRSTTWDAATHAANERYRMLFGVEAYNARTAAAAKDALAEITRQTSSNR